MTGNFWPGDTLMTALFGRRGGPGPVEVRTLRPLDPRSSILAPCRRLWCECLACHRPPRPCSRALQGRRAWCLRGAADRPTKLGLHHACGRGPSNHPASRRCRARGAPPRAAGTATACPSSSEARQKALGLHSKHEIEASPALPTRCTATFARTACYVGVGIERPTGAAGTLDNDYVESVWWLLKQMYYGLLYEDRVRPRAPCARVVARGCWRSTVTLRARRFTRCFPSRRARYLLKAAAGADDHAVARANGWLCHCLHTEHVLRWRCGGGVPRWPDAARARRFPDAR